MLCNIQKAAISKEKWGSSALLWDPAATYLSAQCGKVARRCCGSSCLVLPAFCSSASLHPAQRALSSCPVASQLGGSRPGKIENNRMAKKKNSPFGLFFSLVSGSYLSSRAVASQVLSAYKGLTSVFGMGTGGTPWLNHRNGYGVFSTHLENCIAFQFASIKPSTY